MQKPNSFSNFRRVIKSKMENGRSKNITTPIMNLPDDCLLLIFQGLESHIDRNSFGSTCHRWLQIQNSSRQSLFFNHYCTPSSQISSNEYAFRIYKLLTRFQRLSLLSLSHCTDLRDSGISQLQSLGSSIETLYLDCCFGVSDTGFSLMASGCPRLTFISLYRCNITDIGLEALAKYCLSLKKVNLSFCAITDISLESLAKSCSSLQKVNLSYCTLISDRGIRFLSQSCRQLCSVMISCCEKITGIGFNGCSETLAYVKVVSCKLEPEGISGIVSGGGIEYLDLSSLGVLGDGLAKIGEGFAMKLRVLNLWNCHDISNEVVMKISMGCPLLQEWNLAHCHQINLHGWEAIGSDCHNLEILHVNLCWNLCDSGLQALRDGCKRLSVLYMDNRYARISDLAMELFKSIRVDVKIREEELLGLKLLANLGHPFSLSQECRRLCVVGISHCINITGTGFNGVFTNPNLSLKQIHLDLNQKGDFRNSQWRWDRTSKSFESELGCCGDVWTMIGEGFAVKLRVLNFQMCKSVVGNEAVPKISKGCQVLQEWNQAHCHEIEELSAQHKSKWYQKSYIYII